MEYKVVEVDVKNCDSVKLTGALEPFGKGRWDVFKVEFLYTYGEDSRYRFWMKRTDISMLDLSL